MERSPPSCSWVGTGTVLLTCTLAYCSRSSARCVAGRRLNPSPPRPGLGASERATQLDHMPNLEPCRNRRPPAHRTPYTRTC